MHKSSESISAIAGALAKAQSALVNPEKTMTATIRAQASGQACGQAAERSFRYAPLSAGLEVVRKTLSQHELAVLQTTSIDEPNRMVRLNTVLAHASGEWISSDWPVCPISDMNTPHRMGAALTYARRYSLFALVGIAGEDDLDAPDLAVETTGNGGNDPSPERHSTTSSNFPMTRMPARANIRRPVITRPPVLPAQDSARLRDALLADIAALSPQAATAWAGQMLASKNRLTSDDARAVETAFGAKFAALDLVTEEVLPPVASYADAPIVPVRTPAENLEGSEAVVSNGAVSNVQIERNGSATVHAGGLATHAVAIRPIGKTVRHRNKEHLRFVRTQPCIVCGRQPSDPHHLRFAQPQALGSKVSDEFTVPLCRTHHREAHRASREVSWWQSQALAPLAAAEALWRKSQSGQTTGEPEPQPADDLSGGGLARPRPSEKRVRPPGRRKNRSSNPPMKSADVLQEDRGERSPRSNGR